MYQAFSKKGTLFQGGYYSRTGLFKEEQHLRKYGISITISTDHIEPRGQNRSWFTLTISK